MNETHREKEIERGALLVQFNGIRNFSSNKTSKYPFECMIPWKGMMAASADLKI